MFLKFFLTALLPVLIFAGCEMKEEYGEPYGEIQEKEAAHSQMETDTVNIQKAIAVLHPTEGNNVKGIVSFTREGEGVKVSVNIQGLTPGKHGFHIHENGDCSAPDGLSAGGHFNPTNQQHGARGEGKRHVGDLGNIEADGSGNASIEFIDSDLKFFGQTSIIGRSVIVHEKEDDLKSQPTGDAGGRVACGIIGVAKAE